MLTSRGGTGIPGRLISGGGTILRLCSPQYICSSSILLQYMSSSYRLQEIGEGRLLISFLEVICSQGEMMWVSIKVLSSYRGTISWAHLH